MKALVLLVCSLAVILWGCASKQAYVPVEERAGTVESQPERPGPAETKGHEGITEEELMRREAERKKALAEAERERSALKDIYFDYDSYAITPASLPVLNNLGDWLLANKGVTLVVEGHCDERGTIEYNLALGQRRADAVKDHLVRVGVEGGRIKTISYGKEDPVDPGHTEEAYARNRRAHFRIDKAPDHGTGARSSNASSTQER
jgi:peptidoglycan-associated lipoprotein